MSADQLPKDVRVADLFNHIDMGFLNRRLALTAIGTLRGDFDRLRQSGDDHLTQLQNDHLLVEMLIDMGVAASSPTLVEALHAGKPRLVFMSTERLEACPEVYEAHRVEQHVHFDFIPQKPVVVAYHTQHIVSDTGRMTLASGYEEGHREAMLGILRERPNRFEIEPVVIGAPWLDHQRNRAYSDLVWCAHDHGEILPEDIDEFAKLKDVTVRDADEWMSVMKNTPEDHVKRSLTKLLKEPSKSDWGGEENDHFSSNVTVDGIRRTAAFLLKGPSKFQEMTPSMCGKNGDQIYRMTNSGADISVVQHAHLVGPAVRETLRSFVVAPGRKRKFCIMDGQCTYRLLKAYDLLLKT